MDCFRSRNDHSFANSSDGIVFSLLKACRSNLLRKVVPPVDGINPVSQGVFVAVGSQGFLT